MAARSWNKSRKPLNSPAAVRDAQSVSDSITIALDAMGGDRAPAMVVRGAELALQRHPNVHFLLFGAEDRVAPLLA
jgi:hypothetical protein